MTPITHYGLGNVLNEQGSWSKRSPNTAKPSGSSRTLADAHYDLGNSSFTTRGSGTRRSPNTARRSDSSRMTPSAHVGLGNALMAQGKMEEAIAEYRVAIRLKPDCRRSPHQPRRAPCGAHGKLDEAIAEYRQAIRLKPDDANPHIQLGNLLGKQRMIEEAFAEFKKGCAWSPIPPPPTTTSATS